MTRALPHALHRLARLAVALGAVLAVGTLLGSPALTALAALIVTPLCVDA